jgi:hypothetical protein
MGSDLLNMLTVDGQLAFLLAAAVLTTFGLLLILWRPRHATHRQHDCRTMGCQWLEDKPRP